MRWTILTDSSVLYSVFLAKIKSYGKTISTGNLIRHLRDSHNIREDKTESTRLINDFFTPTPRPRARATVASSSTMNMVTKKDKWILARDLALWFCTSLMPFDSVSDEGMIDFFKKYNIIVSDEDMPSRYTVGRGALDDVYETMLATVKTQILTGTPRHVSITFDLWTDQYRRLNYITFTLHFITADYELKSFTLSTQLVQGKKTGEKIQGLINTTVSEFGLCDKELHTVTDAGSNVKRAISLSGLDSHLCLGHGLHNLVIADGIKNVPSLKELIKKVKKIVKAIRYRLPELEKEAEKEQMEFLQQIENVSEVLENDENEPIGDDDDEVSQNSQIFNDEFGNLNQLPSIKTATPTRWHSVLSMLESLAHCCNRKPVNSILTRIGKEDLKLVQTDWNLLEDLIRFLRKFREAVEVLCAQKNEHHMTRRVMDIDEGKRGRGHPPTNWTRTISKDMTELGLTPAMTKDRNKWRSCIRRADPK
ncbi:uncharacterized protein LOC133518577 [Cydia pomonella]|uniref:uncharacterized protein LOC133518577 n=1 Tax=Cydia pomonella TaxID=82600 RepID=UPI002ADD5D24|nr:uncharacterized protein LOC133518577 [Cydia pomonella]